MIEMCNRFQAIVRALEDKGYKFPEYSPYVRSPYVRYEPESDQVIFYLNPKDENYDGTRTMRASGTPVAWEQCLAKLATEAATMPTLLEWKRGKFREELLAMAERGEALGFGEAFAGELRARAAELASNAIAGPAEIPF